jgi:mediator of RNA polymerase II transcription subunit 14
LPITGQPSISDEFFDHLKIFATGMISQLVDMHLLQERGIRHMELPQPSESLPRQVKLPAVFIRLSEIVPSIAPAQPRINWAFDYVQLTFKGVQQSVNAEHADQSMATVSSLSAVQEATIKVADMTKFKDLKGGNVDSDVTFNSRLGQFSLRLQQQVGASLIDTLAARVQAICRLVDFVDAMRKSGDGIVCESVTMREVVLSYGNELLGYEHAMLQHQPRWVLRLDLASGPRIKVGLDNGNPHLRILDHLETMANSALLSELPAILKSTFSLLQALEEIEQTWQRITENADGSIEITHWNAKSTSIRYTLAGGRPNQPRQAILDIRQGEKLNGQWWILEFRGAETNATVQHNEFFKILKPLFDGRGEQWKGLGVGAAAASGRGTHTLLLAVNTAVMNLVGSPAPPLQPAAAAAPDPSSAPAPVPQMPTPQSIPMAKQRSQQQRSQQQPGPQLKNAGQGRPPPNNNHSSSQNHEVVIID